MFGSSGGGSRHGTRPGSGGTTGNNWVGYRGDSGLPAYNPTSADSTVLLSGLMGLQPRRSPALTTSYNAGTSGGLARRPNLAKRLALGGA